MKKSLIQLFIAIAIAFSMSMLTACGGQKSETTEEEAVAVVYACPMHPEVKGKEGDTCGECGMALEKVEGEESEHEHMQH